MEQSVLKLAQEFESGGQNKKNCVPTFILLEVGPSINYVTPKGSLAMARSVTIAFFSYLSQSEF